MHTSFEVLQELGRGTRLAIRGRKILKAIMQMASSLAAGPDDEFPNQAAVCFPQHNRMFNNSGPGGTAETDARINPVLNEQAFSAFDFGDMETVFTPSWLTESQQLFA